MKREEQLRKDIIDIVSKQPGIGQGDLVRLMHDATGAPAGTLQSILYNMANKHHLVRTRTRGINADGKFVGLYRCWLTVPPNMKGDDFTPIKQLKKRSANKDDTLQASNAARTAPSLARAEEVQVPTAPSAYAYVMPEKVMKAKPGMFSINLTLPDGKQMPITLEQARQMYEQLAMLFGANGL